jgi:aldehyde:ferredoxin oxidoreductase
LRADWYNPNWWIDKFDMFDDVKSKIYSMSPEELSSTWEGKALMCRWFEDLFSIFNASGICFLRASLALGPTHFSALLSACTGYDITPADIMKSGERIFTLLRAYIARIGLSRKHDTWPERFYTEPMPEGPGKGAILSREKIELLLDEYYEIRGWDKTTGTPTVEKLYELGLNDVANDLE